MEERINSTTTPTTSKAKCTRRECIQGPYIQMIDKKLDGLIEDIKESERERNEKDLLRDSKLDAKFDALNLKFDSLDDKYISKKSVTLVLWTIGIASSVVTIIWQILEWYSSLHK